MDNETSRAYIASHIKLRNEVFGNWQAFNKALCSGLDVMKKYLSDMWNSITEKDTMNGFRINDLNRSISESDFNVTHNVLNGINVFYIIFPEPTIIQAQAKCVAVALTPNLPRYFTMEISSNYFTKEPYYILGEWQIENGCFKHVNYGPLNHNTIESFASGILQILNNSQNSNANN